MQINKVCDSRSDSRCSSAQRRLECRACDSRGAPGAGCSCSLGSLGRLPIFWFSTRVRAAECLAPPRLILDLFSTVVLTSFLEQLDGSLCPELRTRNFLWASHESVSSSASPHAPQQTSACNASLSIDLWHKFEQLSVRLPSLWRHTLYSMSMYTQYSN